MCGDRKTIHEKKFNQINGKRESDQRLDKIGIVRDMIEYRETRDYLQHTKKIVQANYLEVTEGSSEDEDYELLQEHNKSTDSRGLHE